MTEETKASTPPDETKSVIFYDTETTGLPNWKIPSDDPSQPHLLQLGAILCDQHTGVVIDRFECLIKPDGWVIPAEITELTGITQERAEAVGIPEEEALDLFLSLRGDALRVAHNRTFDKRIIRIGLKRYKYPEEVQDKWHEKENHDCTMMMAKAAMGVKKWPKLVDALKILCNEDLENAHTAMADTEACMKLWFKMQ